MAVTVLGSPTSPNVTGTKLVYSLSSSLASNPQYQYVVDVKESGSSTLLTRLYAYPNEQGSGIIEVSRILADHLEYDTSALKTLGGTVDIYSHKDFTLHYSESYGTSISSSTTVYAGGASNDIQVFLGTVDPNAGTFNYTPSGSFHGLTNQPTGSVSKGNKLTIPLFVPPTSQVASSKFIVEFLDSSDSVLSTYTSSELAGADQYNIIYAIGSGSLLTAGDFESQDWTTLKVKISGSNEPITQWKRAIPCNGEETTFAFANNYGYFDTYTITNPERKATNLDRKTYDKPNVDYSSATSFYDISRRGTDQYNIKYSDEYEITTDYVDKTTSDWLTELLDSPKVFVQENGEFVPIVITNSTYNWNQTSNRNKLFQYTIQYRYANERYDR